MRNNVNHCIVMVLTQVVTKEYDCEEVNEL